MATVLALAFLCVLCQAHVHEGSPPPLSIDRGYPPLSIDRQLLELLRKTVAKKDVNSSSIQIPVPITSDLGSPASPSQDYGWIKDEFAGIKETLLFPGSDYLVELIRHHCETIFGLGEMEVVDIKDDFELPECPVGDIWKITFKVLKLVKDPDSVALFATRDILRSIFYERVRCPSAVLDMSIARLLMAKKDEYMRTEDESLYSLFKKMAPLVHQVLTPYADDIATTAVAMFHGKVFNESIDFIFGYGLEDVARAQHYIFKGLRDFLRYLDPDMKYNRNSEFVNRIQDNVLKVKCPNEHQLAENHKKIVWRFRDEFEGIETDRICTAAKIFLANYVDARMPGIVVDFEENGNLQIVCEKVRDHVHELVEEARQYESFLYSMNIRDLEDMIRKVMTNAEWVLLKEAVRRLGISETR